MKILDFKRKKSQNSNTACAVQTSIASNHPYYNLSSYMPINGESRVYAELRNAVPILDSAINKIVRLCEGFKFNTGNEKVNDMMNSYFESINVGGNQKGIASFISNYLNQLLTFGTAIGEIVMCDDGIYALYNSELSSIELKRAPNGVDVDFYNYGNKISKPNLILYSVLNPKPAELCGTSLLSGLPFVSDILLEIYNTIGENWRHAGNIRYSVICKPDKDSAYSNASETAQTVAKAWKDAMDSNSVKDFVAVGDVSVKVIGADNAVLDSEIPVKQLLEQIVAKTGLPPFMLGLSWSSTERMSVQQADILTSELESYRRILEPVIKQIGNMYLALNSLNYEANVEWKKITLQDECELAQAQLYTAQAEQIRKEIES